MSHETIMTIVAHADDETIGCGGMLASGSILDHDMHVLVLCSEGMRAPEQIEAGKRAAGVLGVQGFHNFYFRDQRLDKYPFHEIVQRIEALIRQFEPETVFTHHAGDLNLDHRITHQAVLTACRPLPSCSVKQIYGIEVASSTEWGSVPFVPQMYLDITGEPARRKAAALLEYKAEMRDPPHARSLKRIAAQQIVRGAEAGLEEAEAFTVIRIIT